VNRILEQARDPFGGPRFYPAGTHPAAHRARAALRQLREWAERNIETPQSWEVAAHLERQINAVEQGELIAKAHYLLRAKLSDTKEAG
jgi:hypothetical protein